MNDQTTPNGVFDHIAQLERAEREQAHADLWRFITLAVDKPETVLAVDPTRRSMRTLGVTPQETSNWTSMLRQHRDARRRANDPEPKQASAAAAAGIVAADRRVGEARLALEAAEAALAEARDTATAAAFVVEQQVEARREQERLEIALAAAGSPEFHGVAVRLAQDQAEVLVRAQRAQRRSVVLADEAEAKEFETQQRAIMPQPAPGPDYLLGEAPVTEATP